MKELLKEENGVAVYLEQDDSPESPREWDNLGTMVCWHRRYNLGDKRGLKTSPDRWLEGLARECDESKFDDISFELSEEEITYEQYTDKILELIEKNAIILPLSLLDHSGLHMWVGSRPHCSDPAGWDSGQVGWIYVTKDKVIEEYGDFTEKTQEKVRTYLEGEVETYDQYLTGDVWGYIVEVNGENVNSCWGFFGSGYAKKEALDMFNHFLEKQKEEVEQVERIL